MFLATTALSEFWDKNQKILFLGAWCLRPDREHEWESLTYEVMPTVWNDRKRFFEAAEYIDACYERILARLGEYMNAMHGAAFSPRYWRIVIGPWLLYYLHPLYDRYVHLQQALRAYPNLETVTLASGSFRVPENTAGMIELLIDDDGYNLQLFSQLLQGMGYQFRAEPLPPLPESECQPNFRRSILKSAFRRSMHAIERANARRLQIALCDMYTPRPAMWHLAFRTALRALPVEIDQHWPFTIAPAASDERRANLGRIAADDDFQRLAMQALPANFPRIYLESYDDARTSVRRSYPQVPPVIMSATGWYTNEPFKFLAAEAAERGTRLVAMQHGGSYGLARFSAPERHERKVGDSFMAWGWADDVSASCRNLPNPRVSSFLSTVRNGHRALSETVLFVTTQCPRYFYRFDSTPVGSQWADYFEWSLQFLASLSDRVRSRILFRPFYRDYGWRIRERVGERFPGVRLDDRTPLQQRLRESRLVVINYRETSFLETLAADIPTILFWDPQRWEVRNEAEPFFDKLRRAGILWDSPEAAAEKVDEVYDDPWRWWGSAAVQETRWSFANRYALGERDWARSWVRKLRDEIKLSGATKGHHHRPAGAVGEV